jgi:DNA helicase HerA-like ATPase
MSSSEVVKDSFVLGGIVSPNGGSVTSALRFSLAVANRHGLITGATGTGKTVTMQLLAESFSNAGVPVIVPDIKGDLSGIAVSGVASEKISKRLADIDNSAFNGRGVPTMLWRIGSGQEVPLRSTVLEFGPLLLGRILDLNETQCSVLTILFRAADRSGLPLLDDKDLSAVLRWAQNEGKNLEKEFGSFPVQSLAAIQRKLLTFTQASGDYKVFGEPALLISDLIQRAPDGRGVVNVVKATESVTRPQSYAAFLLWMLSEIFEELPEVGNLPIPRLVFFFDEAHLLFSDASSTLVDTIETVVRLIRSKGVGIYFVSQRPSDIPDSILAQLGHRVQHALRGYTPKEQKMIRSAIESIRGAEEIQGVQLVQSLGVGEAIVSLLDEEGVPSPAQKVLIKPPLSRIGPLTELERSDIVKSSPLTARYMKEVDRNSAYEILAAKHNVSLAKDDDSVPKPAEESRSKIKDILSDSFESALKNVFRSVVRSISSEIGRAITRGIFGTISRQGR